MTTDGRTSTTWPELMAGAKRASARADLMGLLYHRQHSIPPFSQPELVATTVLPVLSGIADFLQGSDVPVGDGSYLEVFEQLRDSALSIADQLDRLITGARALSSLG